MTAVRPSSPPPGSVRELLEMSVPLIISSGSLSLMHVCDRMFLTWHSQAELAAALPAGITYWTFLSVFYGTCTYLNSFVGQYEGAGRPERVAAAVWQGVWLALGAGLLLMALAPVAGPMFLAVGHKPEVAELEAAYFQISCLGSPANLLATVLSCFYSGRGRTRVIMWVNVAGSLINILLDYLLIFGVGGFPELGIRGAAMGTVLAQFAMSLMYVGMIVTSPEARTYKFRQACRWERDLFGRLMYYGLPNGFHFLADVLCFTAFVLLVGRLGETAQGATNLAFNLNTLAFLPMMGVCTAVTALVARRLGEDRPDLARKTTFLAFRLAVTYMSIWALLYLLLPHQMLSLFRSEENAAEFPALAALTVRLLVYVAIYQVFDALGLVFGSAIRGAGDTVFPLVFTTICGWCLMVIPIFIGMTWFDTGIDFAWIAASVYIATLGIGLWLRFLEGRWQRMRVIEHAAPALTTSFETDALVLDGDPQADPSPAKVPADA